MLSDIIWKAEREAVIPGLIGVPLGPSVLVWVHVEQFTAISQELVSTFGEKGVFKGAWGRQGHWD